MPPPPKGSALAPHALLSAPGQCGENGESSVQPVFTLWIFPPLPKIPPPGSPSGGLPAEGSGVGLLPIQKALPSAAVPTQSSVLGGYPKLCHPGRRLGTGD